MQCASSKLRSIIDKGRIGEVYTILYTGYWSRILFVSWLCFKHTDQHHYIFICVVNDFNHWFLWRRSFFLLDSSPFLLSPTLLTCCLSQPRICVTRFPTATLLYLHCVCNWRPRESHCIMLTHFRALVTNTRRDKSEWQIMWLSSSTAMMNISGWILCSHEAETFSCYAVFT